MQQINLVLDAIDRSVNYLVERTKDNGMFEYRINLNPKIKPKEKYNILRHAGAIYAMGMCYELQPDVKIKLAIEIAGKYLRDKAIHPVSGEDDNLLAVWSNPEVNRSGKPLQAKLGGTGLGLVALLCIEKIYPGFTPLSDLQSLARFLVYMQKEDGSFYSKYIHLMGGRCDRWQSLYYPGEAVLGLLMLYEQDASEVWLNAAIQALTYLARLRENQTDLPADHWALLATAKLLSLNNINQLSFSQELLINHGIQLCDVMLQSQIENAQKSKYNGGFSRDGKITPTATRLEGLQAALSFIPTNHGSAKRIDSAVSRGISFLLQAQIKEGEFIGAFPRAIGKIPLNRPKAREFNHRATEVRIDYVQHALSAMIQYVQNHSPH